MARRSAQSRNPYHLTSFHAKPRRRHAPTKLAYRPAARYSLSIETSRRTAKPAFRRVGVPQDFILISNSPKRQIHNERLNAGNLRRSFLHLGSNSRCNAFHLWKRSSLVLVVKVSWATASLRGLEQEPEPRAALPFAINTIQKPKNFHSFEKFTSFT